MLLPAFTGPAVRGESAIDGEGRSTGVGDTGHRHSAWLMSLVFPVCAARVTRWEPQCWWTAGVASWLETVTLYAGGGTRKWLKWPVLAPGHSRSYNQAVGRGPGHPQVGWGLDGPQVGPLTWSRQAASGPRPLDSPQGSSPRGEPSEWETRGLRCLCDPASDVTLGHFWRMSVLHRPAPARVGDGPTGVGSGGGAPGRTGGFCGSTGSCAAPCCSDNTDGAQSPTFLQGPSSLDYHLGKPFVPIVSPSEEEEGEGP